MLDHVVFSPRVNLRFNPTPDLNFRASYSGGFRAPQAFDEDLHIAAVGGDVAIIRLAPGLKEEKSRSVSVSADWYHRFGQVRVNLLAEGFYTNLKDVFVLEDISKEDGILTKERRNGSGAEVMGVNLEPGRYLPVGWSCRQGRRCSGAVTRNRKCGARIRRYRQKSGCSGHRMYTDILRRC